MPRRQCSRVYWRDGLAWGDFRDVGGGLQRLVAGRERYATTDPDVAAQLVADQVEEFERRRRSRAVLYGSAMSTT